MFSHRVKFFQDIVPGAAGQAAQFPSGLQLGSAKISYAPGGFSGGTEASPLPAPLPNGATVMEYVGTNPEVGGSSPFQMLVANKRVQVLNPAGAITVRLPTTGVKAGESFKIVNRHASNLITIQSSDSDQMFVLGKGCLTVRALQDTPTDETHWYIEEVIYQAYFDAVRTTIQTGSSTPGTGTDLLSITVPCEGVWELEGAIPLSIDGATGTSPQGVMSTAQITANDNTILALGYGGFANASQTTDVSNAYVRHVVTTTAATTYKLRFTATINTGSPTITTLAAVCSANTPGWFRARLLTPP